MKAFNLTKAEQENLLQAIKAGTDSSNTSLKYKGEIAEKILIDESQLVVEQIAKKYVGISSKKLDDLVKVGNIGLKIAIRKWIEKDINRKYRFIIYATWFIRTEIHKELGLPINSKRIM